ncbi:hypothetical protein ED853_19295, partial [Acinetobacter baumannii]
PKIFPPGGKNFSPRGEKFLGVFKNPQKGGPLFRITYLQRAEKKGGPQKFFPPGGKIFSPGGKNFWGFLKTPKKGAPLF